MISVRHIVRLWGLMIRPTWTTRAMKKPRLVASFSSAPKTKSNLADTTLLRRRCSG
jgi:hypothetical protein